MSHLPDEIREFIVKGLACFDTPSQVAEAVKQTFGIEVSRQHVYGYDPECSRPPAQRWVELHAATRARFLADVSQIGIANKAVRLRMLERYARQAEANRFNGQAAEYLVLAAKECGGAYEGRRALSPSMEVAAQGAAAQGAAAQNAPNDTLPKSTAPNGTPPNRTAPNGTVSNGTVSNGPVSNGPASNGTAT